MLDLSKQDCCGCTACSSICPKEAIQMLEDEKGFLYPHISKELCVECGLCEKVCNYKNHMLHRDEPTILAVKHKDSNVRRNSTSGGFFTALSDYVLKLDGVVYGVKYGENLRVVHTRAVDEKERNKCRGSKYVQSDLRGIFPLVKKDLKEGKTVLFTGTPCQITGLYGYLGQDYPNLLTVDVICHGTPSPRLWREFLDIYEKRSHEKIVYADFRDKRWGWTKSYIFSFVYEKGHKKMWGEECFNRLFLGNFSLRDSCYNCQFRSYNRPSDITMADFWGIDRSAPDFFDEGGVSAVMLNTEKGDRIFSRISESIEISIRNKNELRQDQITGAVKRPQNTDDFWKVYFNKGYIRALKKYTEFSFPKTILKKVKRRLLNMMAGK